jgi:hypothetical protein
MLGIVIKEQLPDFSINSAIELADGMTDADGKQHVFPVAKLIHGPSRPNPLSELTSVQSAYTRKIEGMRT